MHQEGDVEDAKTTLAAWQTCEPTIFGCFCKYQIESFMGRVVPPPPPGIAFICIDVNVSIVGDLYAKRLLA